VADHPLSPGGDTLVVLDTCALLPPRLSDVLFDLALEGLYLPHWTAEIEMEFLRNFQTATGAASADGGARRLRAFRGAPACAMKFSATWIRPTQQASSWARWPFTVP
jgi:hypothetical protein